MTGTRRLATWALVVAASAALGAGATLGLQHLLGPRTTTTRLSPDETTRARLVEVPSRDPTGRNLLVRLEHLETGRTTDLTPGRDDKGRPEGTERLIWSKDGTYLLLVGRHFYVRDDLFLDNGDQAYFLHHLPTGRGWINSAEPSDLPPLRAEQVRGIEFTEPVTLQPR